MRGRSLIWAAVLVAGFWFVTTHADWRWLPRLHPVAASGGAAIETSAPTMRPGSFLPDEQNSIEIYRVAHVATVNITSTVYQRDFFLNLYPSTGVASGFLITDDGQILTNNHVVRGARELTVTLNNQKQYKAHVLGTDPANDMALVKINPNGKIPFLSLGTSDNLQVGQKVLAIGNPFGLSGTLTTGVISSLDRTLGDPESGGRLEGLIQTDAAINRGNSGGPLLDSHGDVIAINTAILSGGNEGSIGIGFAMPINKAKAMLEEYRTKGRIARPVLGLQTVLIKGDIAADLGLPEEGGLLVQRVDSGSPAEEAGLQGPRQVAVVGMYQLGVGGDLVTAIDGKPVASGDDLTRAMNRKRAGDKLALTVFRGGKTQNITVTLGEGPVTL